MNPHEYFKKYGNSGASKEELLRKYWLYLREQEDMRLLMESRGKAESVSSAPAPASGGQITTPLVGFITTWDTEQSGGSPSGQIQLPLESTGIYDFTVDWGDGSQPQNYSSNTKAQYKFTYSSLPSNTITSEGYRQALVKITPQAGANLTAVNFNQRHSDLLELS